MTNHAQPHRDGRNEAARTFMMRIEIPQLWQKDSKRIGITHPPV